MPKELVQARVNGEIKAEAAAVSVRIIKQTGQFKREAKGKHRSTLEDDLMPVLTALTADEPLPPRHCDHALTGDLKSCRDRHVKSDLVLIYQKPDNETLLLVRLGSHAEFEL